jgi:endonuclease-3
MATQSRAQFINEVHAHLKRYYKPKPDKGSSRLTVLEAVIYGICHEGTTREQANQALSRFKDDFFDWNEVRVSTIEEIQGVLAGLPDPEPRAQKIRRFLRQLFEKTYGFTLEPLTKKPLKESLKILSEYEAFQSDYVEATVIRLSLGGHSIPVDGPVLRVMERFRLIEPKANLATIRSFLERAIPKNRGSEFVDLIEELAHDTCLEGEPECPRCDLRKLCPTGIVKKEEAAAALKRAAAQAKVAAKEKMRAAKAKLKAKPKAKVSAKPAAKVAAKPARASAPPSRAKPTPTKAVKRRGAK